MTFWIIKHTDENKFIQFKGGSPYWTTDRFAAAAYESAVDAEIQMRRYGIPYCIVIRRPKLAEMRKDTNVPKEAANNIIDNMDAMDRATGSPTWAEAPGHMLKHLKGEK
jgi:hypothetical protein